LVKLSFNKLKPISNFGNQELNRLLKDAPNIDTGMNIGKVEIIKSKNLLKITIENTNNLTYGELYKNLFTSLKNNKDFNGFSNNKIIFTKGTTPENESLMLHSNLLVNNKTTVAELYDECIPYLEASKYNNYSNDVLAGTAFEKLEVNV
jgi:hypothetical protein